jgi:HlyD family secretion protein
MMRIAYAGAAFAVIALAGCSPSGDGATLQGYVEGTYVYIAPEASGRIVSLAATAGAPVAAGAILVRLDDADEKAAVSGGEARLAQAEAQLANLRSGKRPEEIAVIVAELEEARTAFNSAENDYRRQLVLREKAVVPQSAVDDAKTRRDTAEAHVTATERQLDVARLPARPEEIAAAERNVAAQEAALAQARIALDRRTLTAPAAAEVEETFYQPGEVVPAGQPILSLLPDANKKIRFFLPEPRLDGIRIGGRVAMSCDNCPAGLFAEITFVSTEAEFTPPVIYSRDNREKLVFRVDARPLDAAAALKVGQPVDIHLADGGAS